MPRMKATTTNAAFETIRKMIRHYQLQPNQVVSDFELAETLGISRTPVRDAINKLISYGLLEKEGSRTIVKPIQLDDVYEIFQVREAIETMAVKVIILNGGLTSEQLEQIEDNHHQLSDCISEDRFDDNFKLDAVFHHSLISCAKNSRLIDIHERMTIQGERLRWLTRLTPERYKRTLLEHQEIINAICQKDVESCVKFVSDHMHNSVENYETILHSSQWNKILQTIGQLR